LIAYSVKERGKTGFTLQLEALRIGHSIVLAEPKAGVSFGMQD
jgi:hypothetical protein